MFKFIFKIFGGIVGAICTTAIANGVGFYFNLDEKVIEVVRWLFRASVESQYFTRATIWSFYSIVGLIFLVVWFIFRIDEYLYCLFSPISKFGSFYFVECVPAVKRNIITGKTDTEIRVTLKNANDFLVEFNAVIQGQFNGKYFVNKDGSNSIKFSGFVGAGQNTSLILKIPDVPAFPPQYSAMNISGEFKYDVNYGAAPLGKRLFRVIKAILRKRMRRTMKTITFETPILLNRTPGALRH